MERTRLDDQTTLFLEQIGLPRSADWTLRFVGDDCNLNTMQGDEDCYIIGFDGEMPLCIRASDGSVVIRDEDCERGPRFVNSHILAFAGSLCAFQRYRLAGRRLSDDEATRLARATVQDLTGLDPKAFSNSRNYWPQITEQIIAGLL